MRRSTMALVAASTLIAGMPPTHAQTRMVEPILPQGPVSAYAGAPVKFTLPLSKFVTTAGPLRLKDASTEAKIALPVSARLKPTKVQLSLVLTNSIALVAAKSALVVRFNDATLGQIRLDPASPNAAVNVNIPVDLLRPGFNTLALAVSQHTASDCEDPEAPELWTEIDTSQSFIEMTADYKTGAVRLSDFDAFLAPGIGGTRNLSIVTAGAAVDAQTLSAGAMVAQAAALRAQYEPVKVKKLALTDADWAADDHALIGTSAEIAGAIGADEAAKITGPYLAFSALDKRQTRLIVSGKTPAEVATAAQALAAIDLPLIDGASSVVSEIKNPPAFNSRTLNPDRIYAFQDLGLPSTTVRGAGVTDLLLDLPMAPNLYAPEQANAELMLDLNYGAGFGPGSVLNVEVNGKFVHGISLANENGAAFRGYRIPVPLRDFVGGANRITFSVHMRSQRKDMCAGTSGRYLEMTVFGTSSLRLPPAARMTLQPDLDLFGRTGFPYVGAGKASEVWVSRSELVGAAWTMAARLAQSARHPLSEATWRVGGAPPKGASLQIADAKALSPALFASAMQDIGDQKRVPYGLFSAIPSAKAPSLWEDMLGLPRAEADPAQRPVTGYVRQTGELGRNAVMTAVRAESGEAATTTVITADTPAQLASAVDKLVQPEVWGRAAGDFMMWQDTPESISTVRLSPRFAIGDGQDKMLSLRLYVSQHPWGWLAGAAAALILLSGLSVWILARRKKAG